MALITPLEIDPAYAAPVADPTLATSFGSFNPATYNANTGSASSSTGLSDLTNLNMGLGIAGLIQSAGGIVTGFLNYQTQGILLDIQKDNLKSQDLMATRAADFASGQEDEKVKLLNAESDGGNGVKGLKEINAMVNQSKIARAKAEGSQQVVKAAVKEAKQTEKTAKLDTRPLDNMFEPGDARARYPHGNPILAA